MVKARVEAVKWHNAQKAARLAQAEREARDSMARVATEQNEVIELALAMLYLGEGAKKNSQTAMGNSNPLILKFFVRAIRRLYDIPAEAFTCHLHLRADQDPEHLAHFWSRMLGIPRANFSKPIVDMRTVGSPTYPEYKGVCAVNCSRVAIQRKLLYIANVFCEQIAEKKGG